MKTVYHLVYVAAIVSYLLPVLIVSLRPLRNKRRFWAFSIYFMILGLVHGRYLFDADRELLMMVGVIYNMMDTPILMMVFYRTTYSSSIQQFIKWAMPAYIVIEIINALAFGIDHTAIKYTVGLGLLLVLFLIIWEIAFYTREIEHTYTQRATLLIYSGLLFEFGTYIVVYIFDYFIPNINRQDVHLIFNISSVVGNGIALAGFLFRQPAYLKIIKTSVPAKNLA